ncbi:MAG: hypothetical protein ACRD2S_07350 [Terriglobales bacterium]
MTRIGSSIVAGTFALSIFGAGEAALPPVGLEPPAMDLFASPLDVSGGSPCWVPPAKEETRPFPVELPVAPIDGGGGTAWALPAERPIPLPPTIELAPLSDEGGGIASLPAPGNDATRAPPIKLPDPTDGGGGTTISRPESEVERRPPPERPLAALTDGAGDIADPPDNEDLLREKSPTPRREGGGGTIGRSTRELNRLLARVPDPPAEAGGTTTVGRSSEAGTRPEIPLRELNSGAGATTCGLLSGTADSLPVEACKSGDGGTTAAVGAAIARRAEIEPTFAAGATAASCGKLNRRPEPCSTLVGGATADSGPAGTENSRSFGANNGLAEDGFAAMMLDRFALVAFKSGALISLGVRSLATRKGCSRGCVFGRSRTRGPLPPKAGNVFGGV